MSFVQYNNLPHILAMLDMSSTAFIEPLPVIEFVSQLLNRDIQGRPLSDSDRVKVVSLLITQVLTSLSFETSLIFIFVTLFLLIADKEGTERCEGRSYSPW